MKTAVIVHKQTVVQFFKDGEEIKLSAQDKLLNAIFGTMEETITNFKTEIAVVKYKNQKELTAKFWEVADQFKSFINPDELFVEPNR